MELAYPGDLVHVELRGWARSAPPVVGTYSPAAPGSAIPERTAALASSISANGLRAAITFCTAIEAHPPLAYSELLTDERKQTAEAFWSRANSWLAQCGIAVQKVLIDNGSCYRSFAFQDALGLIEHRRTRPYRPQTNGKWSASTIP